MEKDQSIIELLERLICEAIRDFKVVDFWEADFCAIGIIGSSSDNRLVYISTFNQPPGKYYYECEIADSKDSLENGHYRVIRKGQEEFVGLVKIMEDHLNSLN